MKQDEGKILAIIPDSNDFYKTKVIKENTSYIVEERAYDVMDSVCLYYGSSYEGREKGSKNVLGVSYKLPIIVDNSSHLVFFPTKSKKNDDCYWISLHALDHFEAKGKKSILYLKNGEEYILKVSYNSLKTQILKASRLESVILDRIK